MAGKEKTIQKATLVALGKLIDLARASDPSALKTLSEYGLNPGRAGVFRFISEGEANNILNGGRYLGRFGDGRVDVTSNDAVTTGLSDAFRVLYKPEFDLYKGGDRVRLKNEELGDGWLLGGYDLNDVAAILKRLPDGTYKSIYDRQWAAEHDAAYKAAVESGNRPEALRLLEQAYLRSGVPKTDITVTPDGRAVGWFHGSPYGNHTIFDSSLMNATIGGESAIGKVKGNFLTTDVPSAMRYAGNSATFSVNVPEYTFPITFGQKIANLFGMYKPRKLYPAERVGTLAPKPERLFDTKGTAPVNYVDKTDRVVYPMYVNPGEDVMVLDFQGKPWSQSPVQFPNNFYLSRFVRDDAAKTYREEIVPHKDYETAYKAWTEDPINKYHGSISLNEELFDGGKRSILGWNSAPNYEKVKLVEEFVPKTTNGAVQTAAKEGKTSVLMRNVIDSNGGPKGVGYAIDDFVALQPNQLKIADITYDDNGDLIPLSERFNWLKKGSRWALIPTAAGLSIKATSDNTFNKPLYNPNSPIFYEDYGTSNKTSE